MDKGSKIKFGYIDERYSYKLWENDDFLKNVNIFKKLKCVITKNNYEEKEVRFKEEFLEYLDELNKKIEKEVSVALAEEAGENVVLHKNFNKTVNIKFKGELEFFLVDKMQNLCINLDNNSVYLGKPVDLFMISFLLQPIYMFYRDKEYLVNVKANIYSTGNLIIQYSIPIDNIEFKYFSNAKNNVLDQKACLPKYIENTDNSYEYETNKISLQNAIEKYNIYILKEIKLLDKKVDTNNRSLFTNYSIIDYDGIPETFDGMSIDLSRNIYWILNGPYGYLNERERKVYNNFPDTRYSISAYAALFVTSTHRSVVIFNRQRPKDNESIKKLFENFEYQYVGINDYLSSSLDMILIKKNYYNLVSHHRFDKDTSINEILAKLTKIVKINDFIFHVNYEGYGSVTRLQKHLEENLTDFLPSKNLDNILNYYKEIIQLKEAQSKDRSNTIISIIAMIFPIVFGLDAIESMLNILDSKLNTNLNWFSFEIWIIVAISSIWLIAKGGIYKLLKKIKMKIKRYTKIVTKATKILFKKKKDKIEN